MMRFMMETDGSLVGYGRAEERFLAGKHFLDGWSIIRTRLVIKWWKLRLPNDLFRTKISA
jgi:hypothetical protein